MKLILLLITVLTVNVSAIDCVKVDKLLYKATIYAGETTTSRDTKVSIKAQENVIKLLDISINKCDKNDMLIGIHKMTMEVHKMTLSLITANSLKRNGGGSW